MKLTPLEALVITHLIVDFIFQWNWQSENKQKNYWALFSHCLVYTIGFIPVFWFYQINFLWLILLFISHAVIDQGRSVRWLLEIFKGLKKENFPESKWNILALAMDQILHFAVLTVIVLLS